MQRCYVYIMTNRSETLYTGMTNDLVRRVHQQKMGFVSGFTKKYKIDPLIYFEETDSVLAAIEREKQIKGWLRRRKVALIDSENPEWQDRSMDW